QRLRAALKIADLDVEPLLFEVAEPVGQGKRQIVKRGGPAHAELDVPLLGRLRQRSCRHDPKCASEGPSEAHSPPKMHCDFVQPTASLRPVPRGAAAKPTGASQRG